MILPKQPQRRKTQTKNRKQAPDPTSKFPSAGASKKSTKKTNSRKRY